MNRLWICRAGVNAKYLDIFLEKSRIFLPWEGYLGSFETINTREDAKLLVKSEKAIENRTTISNWGGMIYSFVCEMQIGDYVLIPHRNSHTYTLAKITGQYEYIENLEIRHSRKIKIINNDIPRSIFPQTIQYSLGAFRSLFQIKQISDVLKCIELWEKSKI